MGMRKFITHLSVIAIAIFLLSCENDVVSNNIITPDPIIKSDTVLIINANTIVFTAFLNTQELPVSYYFEFGDSATYGLQTNSMTLDSTNEAFIQISDTVSTIVTNTVYHYRTVVTRPSGIYYSTNKVFSTTFHNPPLITNHSSNSITTFGARLVGEINSNGNNITSLYFEYGTTEEYEYRTPDLSLPPNISGYVYSYLNNLKFGEQYHYRLYLKTIQGDVWSEDKTFNTIPINDPIEFNYPLSVGTKWEYKYHLFFNNTSGVIPPTEVRNGIQSWEVVSVETFNDSVVCHLVSTSKDTVYRSHFLYDPPDTSYEVITVSFTIVSYEYSIWPTWHKVVRYSTYPYVYGAFLPLPRYMENGTVNVQVGHSLYKDDIGLSNYWIHFGGNHTVTEYLNLISFNK